MERYFNGCSIENFELNGKVAVATYGNTEFSKNYVIALARAGVKLIIHTDNTNWDEVRKLAEKEGQEVVFFHGNLHNDQERKNLLNFSLKVYGRLDILINNIEVAIKSPLFIHDNEYYNEVIYKRLSDTYLLIKEAENIMKKGSYGKVINLMMVDSIFKCSEFSYENSSNMLEDMTRKFSKEFIDENIQINCIDNITRDTNPVEVARTIVFLASNLSDNVNGDVISFKRNENNKG